MTTQLRYICSLLVLVSLGGASNHAVGPTISWSVQPLKGTFGQNEPIVLEYNITNVSREKLWVIKSPDPFASVRLRLYAPNGKQMKWNGARFTFRYDKSDLLNLRPGQTIAGRFSIPVRCPTEASMEKGGFCFEKKGQYSGTAEFHMGLNAFYHRDEVQGRLAEGRVRSKKFVFQIQ